MDQAEKLRSVVKLKKQNYKPDARVITVTSGKGGVGKSNVAVNLAVQMQKMGKRVLVFDADFGLANVEVMFGAIPKYNLADVIYHGKQITEIISEGPMGIGFVSGGTGVTGLGNLTDASLFRGTGSDGRCDSGGHRRGDCQSCTGVRAGKPGGSCGHNTGADITDRFLFSVKVSVPESEV